MQLFIDGTQLTKPQMVYVEENIFKAAEPHCLLEYTLW